MIDMGQATKRWCEQVEEPLESIKNYLGHNLRESADHGFHLDCNKLNRIKI